MHDLPGSFLPLERDSGGIVAGIDEAGRGCLAGPVTVGIAIFPGPIFDTPVPESLNGIDDSKKLTPEMRERLVEPIRLHALFSSSVHVSSKIIDRIGINPATELAVQHLLRRADLNGTLPSTVLIDGNYRFRMVEERYPEISVRSVIKGDSLCFSIAAASILAKVARDRRMENKYSKIFPAYHFEKHKGYGTEIHRRLIRERGPCAIHRRTFGW